MGNKFLSVFGFDPARHTVKTEMMAGLTTFLTMSYILAVNPLILSATGMDKGAVFSSTIIAAVIATLTMAVYAKMPFGLAPGMGLNAFFAYTLVITLGYSWQQALAAVAIEGVVFILLTIFKAREAIVNSIPNDLRYAISVGIGLFIAYIGLKNGDVIVASEATMTTMGPWNATSLIAMGGILLGAVLLALKVRGALFYTILIMTVIGIPFGVTNVPEHFTLVSMPASIEPIALSADFSKLLALDVNYIIVMLTLLFMDLFDTIGTLIGASVGAGIVRQGWQGAQSEQSPDGRCCRHDRRCPLWHLYCDYFCGEHNRYHGGWTHGPDLFHSSLVVLCGSVLLAFVSDDTVGGHHQCPVPCGCDDDAAYPEN